MLKAAKATLVGGILFLLPLGVILVVVGKIFQYVVIAGASLHDLAFPQSSSIVGPSIIAILILLLIAYVAGMVAQTRFGVRLFRAFEAGVMSRFPAYSYMRETLADMSGSAELTAGNATRLVVEVRYDDVTRIGFVVSEMPDGRKVVFLPNAPTPLVGIVVIIDTARVFPTSISHRSLFLAMKRLGDGLADAAARADA